MKINKCGQVSRRELIRHVKKIIAVEQLPWRLFKGYPELMKYDKAQRYVELIVKEYRDPRNAGQWAEDKERDLFI